MTGSATARRGARGPVARWARWRTSRADDLLGRLTVGSCVVAELREGSVLPQRLVPRPHLHPVRTIGGLLVTEDEPADHRHHLGVGAAVPLVEDTNLWGGPTFVSGAGYLELHDHGRQDVVTCRGGRRVPAGRPLGQPVGAAAAARTSPRHRPPGPGLARRVGAAALHPAHQPAGPPGRPRQPRASGRAGAGYGGVFWRAPISARDLTVQAPGAIGEREVNGGSTPGCCSPASTRPTGCPGACCSSRRAEPGLSLVRPAARLPRPRSGRGLGPPAEPRRGQRVAHGILAAVVDGHVAPADVPALLVAMPR